MQFRQQSALSVLYHAAATGKCDGMQSVLWHCMAGGTVTGGTVAGGTAAGGTVACYTLTQWHCGTVTLWY